MMLDAKNCPIFRHVSIFGPRLVPQMAIFPMAFGAFSPTIWRDFIGGEVKIVQQQVLPAHGLGTEEPEESSLNVP